MDSDIDDLFVNSPAIAIGFLMAIAGFMGISIWYPLVIGALLMAALHWLRFIVNGGGHDFLDTWPGLLGLALGLGGSIYIAIWVVG